MRILACADIHLGSGLQYGRDDATGTNSRMADWLDTMDNITDIAVENQVDAVIFAGDLFKDRRPTPQLLAYAIRWLNGFYPCPIVLIVGNHDLNGDGSMGPVELMALLESEKIYVSSQPEILTVSTKSGELQVVTMPTFSTSTVKQYDEFRGLPVDQLNTMLAQKGTDIIRYLADQLDPGLPAILALHGTVSGAVNGSERSMMMAQEPIFALHDIALPQFSYVALGHVHRHQALSTLPGQPPVVYSGSIERVDFGELEPKGVVIADFGVPGAVYPKPTKWEFVDLNTRPFVQIDLDPKNIPDVGGAVVKATIQTDLETAKTLSTMQISKQLYEAGASFVAGVQIEVERETRTRDAGMTEHLTTSQALGRYIEQQPDLAARKDRLIAKIAELEAAV